MAGEPGSIPQGYGKGKVGITNDSNTIYKAVQAEGNPNTYNVHMYEKKDGQYKEFFINLSKQPISFTYDKAGQHGNNVVYNSTVQKNANGTTPKWLSAASDAVKENITGIDSEELPDQHNPDISPEQKAALEANSDVFNEIGLMYKSK